MAARGGLSKRARENKRWVPRHRVLCASSADRIEKMIETRERRLGREEIEEGLSETRWKYERLAQEWDWRIGRIFDMRYGGASEADLASVRADVAALFERAGWTEEEFTQQIEKRLDRSIAKQGW